MEESKRGKEWINFAEEVLSHVENYTVPQYGDLPYDPIFSDWGVSDCLLAIKKYTNRVETNARGVKESERDCLKIAHYACLLQAKLRGVGGKR